MGLIIKPDDKINIAEIWFKYSGKQVRTVVGEIVDEKIVFYQLIPNLLPQDKDFKVEE